MLYAAYGSNMHLGQMSYRCPDSRVVGKGMIRNYKLKFSYHADIVPSEGDFVPVVLWEVPEIDFLSLDRYEGVRGGYYERITLAIVYVMCGQHDFQMPSESYYQTIKTGYEDNKISRRYLYNAIIECAKEVGLYEEE